jgi:Tol biopolymer transport system component
MVGHVEAGDNVRVLLVDRIGAFGDVLLLQVDENEIRSTTLLDDCTFFSSNDNGWFVCRSKSGEWRVGNALCTSVPKEGGCVDEVSRTQTALQGDAQTTTVPTRQVVSPSRGVITYATVSGSGEMIAWVVAFDETTGLFLSSPDGKSAQQVLSKEGIILLPSFSPDEKVIAFYCGGRDVGAMDGYSLRALALHTEKTASKSTESGDIKYYDETEIAGPSKWTSLSPARTTPPQWSPDGRRLLFEGRYTDQKFVSRYVVNADGTDLIPEVWGTWSDDGRSIYTVIGEGDSETGYRYRPARCSIVSSGLKKEELIQVVFQVFPFGCAWSGDGVFFVYESRNNEEGRNSLKLLSVRSLKQQNLKISGKAIWLAPRLKAFTIAAPPLPGSAPDVKNRAPSTSP